MKKWLRILVISIIAIALCSVLYGCKTDNNLPNDQNREQADVIEIVGLLEETISITKTEILEIAQTKEVVYTEADPFFSSDKTDDLGNLLPFTLKGVYLDDILEIYAEEVSTQDFSEIKVKASDDYEYTYTSDFYNINQGGSKIIIAYEFKGKTDEGFRSVLPDQIARSWVGNLKTITLVE